MTRYLFTLALLTTPSLAMAGGNYNGGGGCCSHVALAIGFVAMGLIAHARRK